jgi:CheY-like chemotaxis protein
MGDLNVLIIDDDPDFVDALRAVLEAERYNVHSACDADDGFARLREHTPDVILLDIMMGRGAEGFLFARAIKKDERYARIPVVMLTSIRQQTGFDFPGRPIHPQFLPVDEYMEKPVKVELLLETIERRHAEARAG